MTVKVSIIVNCRNGSKYLTKCLNSIKNQEFKDWEVIFWDNQSYDDSKKIFFSFDDKRFKYFLADKLTSLYEARNLACMKATGKFVTFLDCDDWWYNDFLSSRKNFFESKNLKFSYSKFNYFFEKSNKYVINTNTQLPDGKIYDFLSKKYLVAISSLLIETNTLKKINLFNPQYNIIGDYDAVMKICKNNDAHVIQKPLLCIRIHGKNFSDLNRKMAYEEYKNWYFSQTRDDFFKRNQLHFIKKLSYLFIVSLFPNFIKDFFKKK